jgi:hypothetical protein
MAKCKYCGKSAGLFNNAHSECEAQHEREEAERIAREAEAQAKALQIKAILVSPSSESIDEIAISVDRAACNDPGIIQRGIVEWFRYLVGDAGLDAASQARLEILVPAVLAHYGLKSADLPDKLWGRFVRICAIFDLENGILPARVKIDGNLPFNTENGETVVWVFVGVEYLEFKTVRSSSRGYGGISVRVLPGLYTHIGQSAPTSISQGFVLIDTGLLALTDRAILFGGTHKALRIKYRDIVSFTRYDYGFAVCKGNQTATSQAFEVNDDLPGFPFVLLEGLAKMKSAGK